MIHVVDLAIDESATRWTGMANGIQCWNYMILPVDQLKSTVSNKYLGQVSPCLSSHTSNTWTAVTLEWLDQIWKSGLSPLGTVYIFTWILPGTYRQQASRIPNPWTRIDLQDITSIEEVMDPTNCSQLGGRWYRWLNTHPLWRRYTTRSLLSFGIACETYDFATRHARNSTSLMPLT